MKMIHFEALAVEKEKEISKIWKQINANKQNLKEFAELIAKQKKVIRDLTKALENEKCKTKEAIAAGIKSNTNDVKVEIDELRNVQTECIEFVREVIECYDCPDVTYYEEIKARFEEKFPLNEEVLENENCLEATFVNPSMGFACENCDFIAKSKSDLKTHIKKKHKTN